ncbi:hypothetical protein JTB14_032864 [Gonioctena quinquepunctata]|nr:hypothetical protein JTB14_032864 [Gonioctena quinquepunctata]
MEQRFYGFTRRDVRILAFELAEKNTIAHPFNEELQMAGPREIRPLPKKKRFTQPKRRKCGTTAILTSSPYKNELKRELQEKEENKKINLNPYVFKDETNSMKRRIQKKPSRKSKKQKVTTSCEGSSSEKDNENPECLYCGDTYLRSCSEDVGFPVRNVDAGPTMNARGGVGDEELDFVCEKCL